MRTNTIKQVLEGIIQIKKHIENDEDLLNNKTNFYPFNNTLRSKKLIDKYVNIISGYLIKNELINENSKTQEKQNYDRKKIISQLLIVRDSLIDKTWIKKIYFDKVSDEIKMVLQHVEQDEWIDIIIFWEQRNPSILNIIVERYAINTTKNETFDVIYQETFPIKNINTFANELTNRLIKIIKEQILSEGLNNRRSLFGTRTNKFINYYYCSNCIVEWEDVQDCICEGRCPECGMEAQPYYSKQLYEGLHLSKKEHLDSIELPNKTLAKSKRYVRVGFPVAWIDKGKFRYGTVRDIYRDHNNNITIVVNADDVDSSIQIEISLSQVISGVK